MKSKSAITVLIGFLLFFQMEESPAQQGYAKDSLQIKAYTLITYQNSKAVKIELSHVFCDYCSDFQKEAIGEEAKRRAYQNRYLPENRIDDGEKRLAVYIRIAKKDFAAIKEDENNQN